MRIEFLADEFRPGGWLVLLDRVRQSYVDLDDPGYLEFPYVQALAQVLDSLPEGPLRVLHLGGGGLTLPRWVEHVRPGSAQVVAEPDAELAALVAARLPYPDIVRTLPETGRTAVDIVAGPFDAVVVDAFHGGRVPADLVTVEFFERVRTVLELGGVLVMNLADLPGLGWVRRVAAAVAGSFAELVLRAEPGVLDGDEAGNVVLIAAAEIPIEVLVNDDLPYEYGTRPLSGAGLLAFVGGARPFTDKDSARSPEPPEDLWRVELPS